MAANQNRFIPPYDFPLIDAHGLVNREWYKFFAGLHAALGGDGTIDITAGGLPAGIVIVPAGGTIPAAIVPDLDASKITTGAFNDAQIPDLDAAKITTGAFADARVPDLDASKVTTGTFTAGQIPDLDASKTTTGVFDPARIPP